MTQNSNQISIAAFAEEAPKNVVPILIGVMLGVLLAALDNSIVSTAMPNIITQLSGAELYSWPFTAYLLCSTVIIPISGKFADNYGRKLIYLYGISIFIFASFLCGISQTMIQLILARGLQGMGGGIILSSAFTIVGELFSPRERGKYMGYVSSMFGFASILGPSLGGYLTEHFGWHWIFLVNIPLGIIALLAVYIYMPANSSLSLVKKKIEIAGIILLILAIVPMLLALNWGGDLFDWNSLTIIGMFAFSAIMLLVFIRNERQSDNPIIPLHLFQSRIFNVSVISIMLSNITFFACVIFIPLYVKSVLNKSASETGATITPLMLSFVASAIISGRLVANTGKYKFIVMLGFSFALVGMFLLSQLGVNIPNGYLIPVLILVGSGLGQLTPVFNLCVQNAFPQRELGVVTSSVAFFRNIGGSLGSAILGAVMLFTLRDEFAFFFQNHQFPAQVQQILHKPTDLFNENKIGLLGKFLNKSQIAELFGTMQIALPQSLRLIFLIGFFTSLVGLIFSFFLKEIPMKTQSDMDKERANR